MMLATHAKEILEKRYCLRNAKDERIEEAEQVFRRVAQAVAKAEPEDKRVEYEEKFYELMSSLKFVPNSPALSNAGARTGQLAACFVLPIDDSMKSILDAQKEMGLIQATGGGTGFSFSRLRPAGDGVSSTNGYSSGPISFLKMFDSTSEAIKQGGTRRGANMGILRCDHPDIVEFVKCKEKEGHIANFNLSVGITDKFMEAIVSGNTQWELINPHSNTVWKTIDARVLFDMIVHNAWKNGEPGVVFLDTINKLSPIQNTIQLEATNPCGEQPLPPYDACNLGSINLASFVRGVGESAIFDFDGFEETVRIGVRFLDDVIDVCKYPLPQIAEMVRSYRRIGLGIMGLGDTFILMKIPYDSSKAFEFVNELGKRFQTTAWQTSEALGEEKGCFPKQQETLLKGSKPLRNLSVTTVAPTGTCSLIADCSSGIEPIFAFSYEREIVSVGRVRIWNSAVQAILKHLQIDTLSSSSEDDVKKQLPDDWRSVLLTVLDVSPANHVRIQAEFQKYIDSGISKTINMPNDATEEDVKNALMLAHKTGCKSITVYRDGSRVTQIIERDGKQAKAIAEGKVSVRERPRITTGYTEKCPTGCGRLYVTLNSDSQGLCEVFAEGGKSGACITSWIESVTRLISLALRVGVDPQVIVKHLGENRCQSATFDGSRLVLSCSDAIAKAIVRHEKDHTSIVEGKSSKLFEPTQMPKLTQDMLGAYGFCPDCSTKMVVQEGCFHCPACGYSKCG